MAFQVSTQWNIIINAITTVDPFLGIVEIRRLKNNTCAHACTKFYEIMWLSRYPRPLCCIHDNGSEFIGQEFQDLLKYYGIQSVSTTVKNPQANDIIERMHQTAAVHSFDLWLLSEAQLAGCHLILADVEDFVDAAPLVSVQHAINSSIHMTTRHTPAVL